MALLTLRAHLATMNVGVAVGALVTYISENRARVTLGTGNTLMHTSQWKVRAGVIELGNVADRLPTGKSVAILARDVQWSMGTARTPRVRRLVLWCSLRLLPGERPSEEHYG